MIKHVCAIALLALPVSLLAQASTQADGRISRIHILSGGQAIFFSDGARTATPPCHTITDRWAFNVTTPTGQAILSLLLSAQTSGRRVMVQGNGNCEVWSDTETVNMIVTEN